MLSHAAAADRTGMGRSKPDMVGTILWMTGIGAGIAAILMRHWPPDSLIALLGALGVSMALAGLRLVFGMRVSALWATQINIGIANTLVTITTAVGVSQKVDLSNLYIMIALYAVLYLPTRAWLIHIAFAGSAYALVLALQPTSDDPPFLSWISVFGTVAVLVMVVLGLVSMLRSAAMQDPLTGLANRRSFDERLAEEIHRSGRTGAALSIALIDLDGFKAMNDLYGHEAGDRVLQELARSWQPVLRGGGDFLARIGGDEFVLLAPGSDTAGIGQLAERLSDVSTTDVSWSIGMVTWNGTEHANELLRRADAAMYAQKQQQAVRRRTEPDVSVPLGQR